MAAGAVKSTFRAGTKQVFLPSHVITLMRPPKKLPPQYAKFRVPLSFNKLDLKDYLRNAYNVEALKVTSLLLQPPVRRDRFNKKLTRPPPRKYMTIEMEKPFVWPAEPDPLERGQYDPQDDLAKAAQKRESEFEENPDMRAKYGKREDGTKREKPLGRLEKVDWHKRALEEQAKKLLSGEVKWENQRTLDPRWTEVKKTMEHKVIEWKLEEKKRQERKAGKAERMEKERKGL